MKTQQQKFSEYVKRDIETSPSIRLGERIDNCGNLVFRAKCYEPNCLSEWSGSASLCGVNYCFKDYCIDYRVRKHFRRMLRYNIETEKMFHMVVGFPLYYAFPDKAEIKRHKKILNRFDQTIRRIPVMVDGKPLRKMVGGKSEIVRKYKFKRLRASDVEITQRDDGSIVFFIHYHYAVLPERGLGRCAAEFNDAIRRVSGDEVKVVKQLGKRNTHGLIKYLSNRLAGKFGHADKSGTGKLSIEYGYSYFMDLDDYVEKVHGAKGFSASGFSYQISAEEVERKIYESKFGSLPREALGSIIRLSTQRYCRECGSFNIKVVVVAKDAVKTHIGSNWDKLNFEEFCARLKSEYVEHYETGDGCD